MTRRRVLSHRRVAALPCVLALYSLLGGLPACSTGPASVTQRELSVGSGRWALPGTLALPEGEGAHPALVLVHGWGPADRDATIGPNKPFRDLAHGLARRGVAVLRYEKVTRQHAEAVAAEIGDALTLERESVDDALAAVELLRSVEGVDKDRIFVLGHSVGGTAVPRIARRDPHIRGFIILAGATRPLEDILVRQALHIASLDGTISEREKPILEKLETQAERVKRLTPSSQISAARLPLGIPANYWIDLAAYPPAKLFAGETRPVLVLHGDRDYQVSLDDLEGWKRALASSPLATFKRYPALDHLFGEGRGPSVPSDYLLPRRVAGYVIADIAAWIHDQT